MLKDHLYVFEQVVLFSCTECDTELTVLTYNSSSVWMEVNRQGQEVSWSGKGGSQWAASSDDQQPWLELELGNKSSVTGH